MELPSGRKIVYRDAHIAKVKVTKVLRSEETGEPLLDSDGKPRTETSTQERIAYSGLNLAKKWVKITTWGGKLVENATQAVARDLLADALVRLDARGVPLNTTIHDEILAEPPFEERDRTMTLMRNVMTTPPAWARGLPLGAEGKPMMRYGKG
jgi:DNA polymerase